MAKRKEKTEKRSKTHQRNLSIMKLLVSTEEFQIIIDEVREYLGIPVDGLETNEECEKWIDEMSKSSDKMILEIKSGNSQYSAIDIPWKYFSHKTREIALKFNLPANFVDHIRDYLLFNKITAPTNNFAVIDPFPKDIDQKPRSLRVDIYHQLTDDDLSDLKHFVNNLCKLEKAPKLRNIDRDILYEETREDLERFNEVEYKEYKMTISEAAFELKDQPSVKKVYDSHRSLDRARKKVFKLGK